LTLWWGLVRVTQPLQLQLALPQSRVSACHAIALLLLPALLLALLLAQAQLLQQSCCCPWLWVWMLACCCHCQRGLLLSEQVLRWPQLGLLLLPALVLLGQQQGAF
jgi:hypothetical protein